LNIDIDDTNIILYPDTVGNYSLFVLGKSITSFAYKAVDLDVICGANSQNIMLAEDSAETINVIKDQAGDFEIIFTETDTEAFFSEEYTDQCLIQNYTLVDSDGNDIADDSELYSLLNLAARDNNSVEFNSTYSGAGDEIEVTYEF